MQTSSPPHKKLKAAINMSGETNELDAKALNKFSRQNAALGADTTAKLRKMSVLIVGMRGIGVETAKNLALQGLGGLTVVDATPCSTSDLGVNFFITEADIEKGISRADASVPRLRELNPLCKMEVAASLSDELVKASSALVITQIMPTTELVRLNELCRGLGIAFFYAFTGGVSTSVFADFGPKHEVCDPDGEKPVQKLIVDITSMGAETLVRYDHPSGQLPLAISPPGSFEITEVKGVDGINSKILPISHESNDPVKTVRIPFDSSAAAPYVSGGLLTEKKLPVPHPMKSLAEKIKDPGSAFDFPPSLVLTDLLNFGSETQQHVALWATHKFYEASGRFPDPNSSGDVDKVMECAKAMLESKDLDLPDFEIDEDVFKSFARLSSVELQPMSAFTGGVLAQEVVKCTGKFTPIPGFLHFASRESLPDDQPAAADCMPKGSRYDALAAVYGWPFVEALNNLKYFMVGCGALGCEFMKNFALNGVCCGPNGKLLVTDADKIELSNLTRQFLFREHNVGQYKAQAAGNMAKEMNRDFKVEALVHYVGPKTENVFTDDFWLGLDGVCNALDNMEARQYVDSACVKYEKSLLESGTMGTSGNVDTVVPFKTRTYREGGKAAEGGGVPMCTLRNFPQITDHCIEWARDQFALLFTKLVKSAENYLVDAAAFEREVMGLSETAQGIFTIRSVNSIIKAMKAPSIGTCAQVGFDIFHFLFRDKILDLQNTYPPDARIIDKHGVDKGPFWGEKKRYPTVAVFDPTDESHRLFLLSATALYGVAVGLIPAKEEEDETWLKDYRAPEFITGIAASLKVPEYVFSPVVNEEDEGADKEKEKGPPVKKEDLLRGLLDQLSADAQGLAHPPMVVADFEKDDDANFHIDFITSCANLRCDNYSIQRTNFQSCKVIAGKIIAAIATTTAAVCGLVLLELFKVLLKKPTDSYMNRQVGLATNTYTSFTADPPKKFKTFTESIYPEPDAPLPPEAFDEHGKLRDEYIEKAVRKAYPEDHSVWDKLVCPASLTLKQFCDWMASEHKIKVNTWDFIIGYKPVVNEDGKKEGMAGVSAPVYPPKAVLDYSLLPALDLSMAQATQAIMRTAAAKPTQQYIQLWKQCKADGVIPEAAPVDPDMITADTTIKEILMKMEALGVAAEDNKAVESRTVTGVADRRFWIVPGNEMPTCTDMESFEDITYMAAMKFTL